MINALRIILPGLFIIISCQQTSTNEAEEEGKVQTVKNLPSSSIADIEAGIKSYIADKTKEAGGYFHIKDGEHNLRLKLVRVHTEYLSNLGPQRHFACVDLADEKGDVYDVDFFLEGKPGKMTITETTVHKLNGKPFYAWKQQEDKTWKKIPVKDASSDLLGLVEGEDEFEFRYESVLPELTEETKMWMPIAQSDNFQTITITSLNAPGKQQMLEEKEYGNVVLYLELKPKHSGDTVQVVYNVKRKEKGPYEEPGTDLEKYLVSSPLIPVGGRFLEIANEAIQKVKEDGELMQARALYDYTIDNMLYQKSGEYGTGDANYACDSRKGNCTEFHSFFISLARSVGIPARFSIGASIPSERDEGGIDGYHCWAEFFAEGKWWPLDISEGNKYTALATYYFGHHPANRIELSRGRDLVVNPGPDSGIHFLAYPVLEMGGKTVATKTTFSFKRKTL